MMREGVRVPARYVRQNNEDTKESRDEGCTMARQAESSVLHECLHSG